MIDSTSAPSLDTLTLEFFAALDGARFMLRHPGGEIEVTLAESRGLGSVRPGERQAFSLLFRGPPAPVVPQQMVTLEHPEFRLDGIFIVPLGPQGDAMRYEAIFT